MIVLLPLFVVSKLPAVTALRGNGSLNCSRLSSATRLRGLPRDDRLRLHPELEIAVGVPRQGPGQLYAVPVVVLVPLCAASAWARSTRRAAARRCRGSASST